jgi:hypothetical protein
VPENSTKDLAVVAAMRRRQLRDTLSEAHRRATYFIYAVVFNVASCKTVSEAPRRATYFIYAVVFNRKLKEIE